MTAENQPHSTHNPSDFWKDAKRVVVETGVTDFGAYEVAELTLTESQQQKYLDAYGCDLHRSGKGDGELAADYPNDCPACLHEQQRRVTLQGSQEPKSPQYLNVLPHPEEGKILPACPQDRPFSTEI